MRPLCKGRRRCTARSCPACTCRPGSCRGWCTCRRPHRYPRCSGTRTQASRHSCRSCRCCRRCRGRACRPCTRPLCSCQPSCRSTRLRRTWCHSQRDRVRRCPSYRRRCRRCSRCRRRRPSAYPWRRSPSRTHRRPYTRRRHRTRRRPSRCERSRAWRHSCPSCSSCRRHRPWLDRLCRRRRHKRLRWCIGCRRRHKASWKERSEPHKRPSLSCTPEQCKARSRRDIRPRIPA